jgi:hypothetical protein
MGMRSTCESLLRGQSFFKSIDLFSLSHCGERYGKGSSACIGCVSSTRAGLDQHFYFEGEFYPDNGPDIVPDLYRHSTDSPAGTISHGVTQHVGQRVRGFFTGGIDAREFYPLVIREKAAVIAKVKIVTWHSVNCS